MRRGVAIALLTFAGSAFAQTAGSFDLAPADMRRIDELLMQQRLDQQRLEIEQWLLQREVERRGSVPDEQEKNRRLDRQRDAFQVERDLQAQRFQLERQRLRQSLARQPLQPPTVPGALRLP